MQTVSEAWKANQDALVRSQGFVDVTLGENQVIPSDKIKELTHSRSYDPMGFELPTNNITIDIFNYDGAYTQLYEDYAGERIKVTVQYGYYLNGSQETIPGGIFWTTDITFADNILTITADCSLALVDDEATFEYSRGELPRMIWESSQTGDNYTGELPQTILYADTTDDSGLRFSEIREIISQKSGLVFISNPAFDNMQCPPVDISEKQLAMIQMMINSSLQTVFVGRDDGVIIRETPFNSGMVVKQSNCISYPQYSVSKKIRKLEIDSYHPPFFADGNTYTASSDTFAQFTMRSINEIIKKATFNTTRNEFWIKSIEKIQSETDDGSMVIRYRLKIKNDAPMYKDILFETQVLNSIQSKVSLQVNQSGEICDITNTIMAPVSTDKIISYFANRKLYDFELRGDPARDVGDYVMVSLTDDEDVTTYQKALVLASELRFNGSFKESLTVRIIETEFE